MKKIGIACDHAGFQMKEFLVGYLSTKGYEVVDFVTYSEESIDYPDFGHALASAIEAGDFEQGVGLCGSGEGMAMTLNKHQGIRAGLCWSAEIASLTRQHNNANIIAFGARVIGTATAEMIVDEFLSAEYEGGRHQNRIDMISAIERGEM